MCLLVTVFRGGLIHIRHALENFHQQNGVCGIVCSCWKTCSSVFMLMKKHVFGKHVPSWYLLTIRKILYIKIYNQLPPLSTK